MSGVVLAIDQGTSGDQGARRLPGAGRARRRPRAGAPGLPRRRRGRAGPAGAAGLGGRRGPRRRSPRPASRSRPSASPTRARPCWRGTAAPAARSSTARRLAGPARRDGLRRASPPHADRLARASPACPSTRTSRRPKMAWLREQRDRRRRRHHERRVAGPPAHRRVRHRRRDRVAHAAARPRRGALVGRGAATLFGLDRRATCPRSSTATPSVGETDAFGGRRPGHRAHRRPAGGAARRALPRRRRRRSARTAPARSCSPTPAASAVRSTSGCARRVAWRRRRPTLLPRRAGLHGRRPPSRWLDRPRAHRRRRRPRRGSAATVADTGGVALRARPRRAGAPWWRRDARARSPGSASSTSRGHLVRARRARASPPRSPTLGRRRRAPTSARRSTALRVDGGLTRSRAADADAGRPAAGAGRGLPVARTPPRSASPRCARLGARRRRCGRPTPSSAWRPAGEYEPRIGADEAAERLARPAARGRGDRRSRAVTAPRAPTATTSRRRRRRRRRGDRPRARATTTCASRWSRPADDVGDGHQQGQHRDPAHRLRRHAGHARVAARRAAATSCSPTTPRRPASRSSAPARCSSPGTTSSSPRCPALAEKARAQRLRRRAGSSTRDELYAREPHLGPGALGGARRCPARASSARGRPPLAFATEAVARRRRAAARDAG